MNSLHAQTRANLEDFFSGVSIKPVINEKYFFAEDCEGSTTLPCLTTKEVKNFRFGPVELTNGGEHGIDDIPYNKLSLLFSDKAHTKLVGLILRIEKRSEAKMIGKYVASKYGTAKILSPVPKPDAKGKILGYPAELYTNAKQSIIVADNYTVIDGKASFSTDLFIVNNEVKVSDPGADNTVANRVIMTYKTIN
ncbi:hypothetical protein [Pedobacter sp. L105]|uniref:hypothetical protein n=1 Tax=Pedobacter sp. L105 TaxID=1641871 RepID=UPI00131D1141|nr:hypothetical protein [Pedobacter sp. L105]